MNYFKCSVGGSGKGNTVIVTCAEEFAGQTIVLAKIGKRYTKTCPSTSPYEVRFYGVESGTYTVSATVQGQTYSETVVVQDVSCVLNYGFTWKTWVDTAQYLDSTDYASLSEVLADEEAVRELFLEHACVDYMADSTNSNADLETIIENDLCAKWINNSDYALDFLGANTVIKALMDTADKYGYGEWVNNNGTWGPKGNVPVMTANNAPYGETFGSSKSSGDYCNPFKTKNYYDVPVGDSADGSYQWMSNGSSSSEYPSPTGTVHIGYSFVNPTCVKRIAIGGRRNHEWYQIREFRLYGSNNKSDWELIGTYETNIAWDTKPYVEIDIDNNSYYFHYKINPTSTWGNESGVDRNKYCSATFLQFYGRELSVSVPTMTSNTAPYGVASATNEYSDFKAWKAFMGTNTGDSTSWIANAADARISYDFQKSVVVKFVHFENRNYGGDENGRITSFRIQASNNGTNWADITDTISRTITTVKQPTDVILTNTTPYRYWALHGLTASTSLTGASMLQFYGLDYSEKEFEVGTTKKWLYDHGVELEEMTLTNTNANTTGEKRSNEVLIAKTGTSNASQVVTQFDLTPYSLLRCVLGNEMSTNVSDGTCGRLCVLSSALIDISNMSNIVAATVIHVPSDKNIPNNISVGVESCDNTYYVGLEVHGESNYTMRNTLKELWLE